MIRASIRKRRIPWFSFPSSLLRNSSFSDLKNPPNQCPFDSAPLPQGCPALVSVSPGSVHQPPLAPASEGDSFQTTAVRQVAPVSRQATAKHLEAVRRSLEEAQFSRETADRIVAPKAHPQRPSMMENDTFSVLGVVDGTQILSLPLFP